MQPDFDITRSGSGIPGPPPEVEPLSPKRTLSIVDESPSPPSPQLRRQTAIRRDGSSPDLKARSSRAYLGRISSPLHHELAASAHATQSSLADLTTSETSSEGAATVRAGARIRNGSISRNGTSKLALSFAQGDDDDPTGIVAHKRLSALSGDDPRTPRPRDAHTDSPVSATSSYDSEDDKQLLTPLDGSGSSIALDDAAMATPLSDSFSRASISTPPEPLTAARVGMRLGIGNIGASTDVGSLGIGLDGRRGMPDATPSPKPDDDLSKRDLSAPMMRTTSSSQRAPVLSRETLYQIGTVAGLTPPVSSVTATGGLPTEVSSVVSNGLEMGLGVNLASSALINSIPGATSAVSGLAEPRYHRPGGTSYDSAPLQRDAFSPVLTDRAPAQAAPKPQTRSQSPSTDGAESDLHRRRTTGWMEGNGRRPDPSRQARHHRADTHDPIISHARSQLLQQQHEKQQHHQNNYISLRSSPMITTQDLPIGYMLDMPLSAETSLDRNSSLGGHSSTRARASISGSTHPETPSFGEHATLSPDAHMHADGLNPFQLRGDGMRGGAGRANRAHDHPVAEVLPRLISDIPLTGHEGETVTIAEYGCLNTRSVQLMQPIISWFAEKAQQGASPANTAADAAADPSTGYFGLGGEPSLGASMRTALGSGPKSDVPCRVNFSIVHEDSPQADFRPVAQTLNSSSDSYLNSHWQATHEPSLQNAIFQSFVSRPFASRIVPPSTVHLGISLMDLHWSHTPRNPAVSQATSAHAELTAFLTARAHDRLADDGGGGGGSVVDLSDAMSPPPSVPGVFRERSRSNSTPNRPTVTSPTSTSTRRSTDIWTTLTDTLAPCLQRLVSCGMLKSDVARHLLTLPMHPRTPKQTQNVLRSVKHLWSVEWSCGLDEALPPSEDHTPTGASELRSEAEPLRLPHPAWKALQAGTLSRVAFAEHMIQLFKNLYEAHFRVILREKGRLSKGAVEFVLDSLWDVLQSRIDDQEPCPIAQCELEVQVVALRRL
ncbi:uncharacterized protein PFL1_02861 [Pseudozyma flocculosa PF-1]|uniref:Uncharacterized protein n=1 Tax=Pseudozyma flocculosa PF-1 TaxID=1277687 RepID=A0A061HG75_9BASI|nr:uncharacterized protein PFL1_02861 [Pseudozyma flocculosa PF-1]EPQ29641.1 hypothetical protein PFL1_02861 [Pseudozyma flocculosa PF-1]